MTTYTATYHTPTSYAEHDLDAATAAEALSKARALVKAAPLAFDWQSYDADAGDLEEIEITDDAGDDVAVWQSDDLRLQLAASELRYVLQRASAALNAAPRFRIPGQG
jgi:hypothetical protein